MTTEAKAEANTKKCLTFQLMPNDSKEKAKRSLDHALMSGKPAKISNKEILTELVNLLSDQKFSGYDVRFIKRSDLNSNVMVNFSLEEIKTALESGIECRPS